MPDRWGDGLRACARSLDTLVLPAARAAGDSLATEQVSLMSRYLGFLAERLDLDRERSLTLLASYTELGSRTVAALDRAGALPEVARQLEADGGRAEGLSSEPRTPASALDDCTNALKTGISKALRLLAGDPAPVRAEIESAVAEQAAHVVMLGRSWFAPLRWESGDTPIPPIEELVGRR